MVILKQQRLRFLFFPTKIQQLLLFLTLLLFASAFDVPTPTRASPLFLRFSSRNNNNKLMNESSHVSTPLLVAATSNNTDEPQNAPQRPFPSNKLLRVLYWAIGTSLGVWFLGIHAPPMLRQRKILWNDPLFFVHLLGSYGVYVACMHNALITPSLQRTLHVWIGRIGMVCGLVSFVPGAILALGRYIKIDPVFSIFITIGGIFQLGAQYYGYKAIRRYQEIAKELEASPAATDNEELAKEQYRCLRVHIGNMLSLFFMACGIPAVIRLSSVPTGKDNIVLMILGIAILNALSMRHSVTFRKND